MAKKKIEEEAKNPLLNDEEEELESGDVDNSTPEEEAKNPVISHKKEINVETPKAGLPMGAERFNAQNALQSDALNMKGVLDRQRKVTFLIPLAEGEKAGSFEEVFINGYRMTIAKGSMVEIPEQVAHMLAEKYRIQLEAGKDMRIDRSENTQSALS